MADISDYNKYKKKKQTFDEYLQEKYGEGGVSDIAPVTAPTAKKDNRKWYEGWFEKGAFEDGWQRGDVLKTIGATTKDLETNVMAGVLGIGETAVDTGAYLIGGLGSLFNKDFGDRMKAFIETDLYDAEAVARKIVTARDPIAWVAGEHLSEENSLLGERADSLAQSGGQLLGAAALQTAYVPWFVTMGVTSFGGEVENAFSQDANYVEAGLSGAISAAAEILTEKISGGINFGAGTLDDVLTKQLATGISNKLGRALLKLGIDVAGEGGEEVISQFASNLGSALYREENLGDILFNEEAVDGYIESFIGGAVLGGGSSVSKAIQSNAVHRDATSGMTANEEKVFKKVYESRLAEEAEKKGRKLNLSEKNKIYDEVENDLKKGYIGTDTIEEVLGGKTYESYKSAIEKKDADQAGKLKSQLTDEVQKGFSVEKDGKTTLVDKYLAESYNERARRGQAFEADLSKYNEKQQETVKKAIESGILNNTNRTHELVDMIANLSADKGVPFDFANNKRLKESGFAIDGVDVNGYVTKDGITINIDSHKALNAIVGHEITHVLGAEHYKALQDALFAYAKTKGDYQSRYDSLAKTYKGVKDANVEAELTSDLVGDYLFTDEDFVRHLSAHNRNVFQKIFDEIKYLWKIATAGSKEKRELERIKHTFEQVYRESGKTSTETKHSLGYHAGDLGKSEGYHMQGGGRDTGHFGTGTYFVGDEAKINDSYYGKRPHHSVEFDNYNLYKVHTDKDGYQLHENLRTLDRGVSQEFLDAAIADKYKVSEMQSEAFRLAEKYDTKEMNEDLGFEISTDYIGASIRAMSEVAEANGVEVKSYDEWLSEQSDDVPKQGDSDYEYYKRDYHDYLRDSLETADEARNKGYDKFRDAYFDLWLKLGKNKVNHALQEVVNHQAKMEEGGDAVQYGADSNATVFMKALGYEGIDVRGTGLDNVAYGSVIYDLKGEDLVRKNEIGTAKYSISLDKKWDESYNYTTTDDFVQEVSRGDRHTFARSLANKTSGLADGETRTVQIYCRDKVYSFVANGYMQGYVAKSEYVDVIEARKRRFEEYNENDFDTDRTVVSLWSKPISDQSRGQADNVSLSSRRRGSAFDDSLPKDTPNGTREGNNERVRENTYSQEEIDEIVTKLREMYGSDANKSNVTFAENQSNEIAPINEASSTDGVFFDGTNPKYSLSDSNGKQLTKEQSDYFKDSNQIKSVANEKPTKNADIRFSLSSDSEGRTLSEGQKKYFNGSKVVDDNGNLRVVYHGSGAEFTEFSYDFMSTHGSMEGQGFYFTDSKTMAGGYQKNGAKLMEGYLDIKKPLSDSEKTLSRAEVTKLIKAIDPTGDDVVINYDPMGGMGYPSKAWYNRALAATVDNIIQYCDTDSEILADIANSGAGTEAVVRKAREVLGYDGYIVRGKYDGADVYVAFESNQFKNIDNLNPTSDPDVRRSLSKDGEVPVKYGSYNISGDDVRLEAPMGEVAPVQEGVAENATTTTTVSETEQVAPVVTDETQAPKGDIAPVKDTSGTTPQQSAGEQPNIKQRKWIGTSTDSDAVDGQVKTDDIPDDVRYYQPIPNKVTLGNANAKIESMGYESSVAYFNGQFANKRVSLDDIALGERLVQEAVKRGDTATASDLIENIAILGTELGQKVQALSIIKRLTPEGQLGMLQKIVERGKAKGDKAFEGVDVTQEMKDEILNVYDKDGKYDQAQLNETVERVKKKIADKMKVTKLEKVNAWRYLSMLGNPKTHIRNLVSNVAMRGTVAVKNAVARTIESVAPIGNRTKTWKRASDVVKAFSEKTALDMKDVLSDGGKYSEEASIKAKRDTFKNKVLNKVYNLNSDLLSKEDWWFSKPAFTSALSEYLTANGIETEQDIEKHPEVIAKAKQYATEQAQIATFRQYSWLANKINDIENHNAATSIALGAVLPFKKTPINIAKTALNYSPIGFAKTLTYDASQVKNGKMEASELVDHLSQNITGTALTLVGYLLASSGFLNGGGEDDKEGKYDYQLGEQAYSINIGDDTFSLSWLSPIAMPLFVGANAYEQLVEGKEWNGDVVMETLAQTLDPLSEMSFLSSLDSVLSSYDSGIQKFAGIAQSAAQSYATQFIPTLSSQVASVMDDTKRTTKVAGDSDFKFVDETINELKYKIPFLRETLEPSTDIWGNEVNQTENLVTRAIETFIAPYSKREDISTAIDSEIRSLYRITGDDGLIPSIPNNYVNYKNEKYKMSAEEYTAFKKTYGQVAYNLLESLFRLQAYQTASDKDKANMVNKVYSYARDVAKQEFLSGKGVF